MSDIEEEVLEKVRPSPEVQKEIHDSSDSLLEIFDTKLKDEGQPLLVGSVAKGTNLRELDIDIFISFPLSVSKKRMEEKILSVGREILEETKEKYAEHPYIHGKYNGFKTDIVPCYDIDDISQMKSAVDRTPFHTDYIKEKLSGEQKDEVRLLKAFLKGIGAYGAKAKVWGFSGYLCELLVLKYGSFLKVLKDGSTWREGETIEIKKGKKDFDDPLIVIDPVDPERNVASALSLEKMSLFTYASKRYLKSPKEKFFFPKARKERGRSELREKIDKRLTSIRAISFPTPDVVEDNLYPQVEKALKKINKHLEKLDFEVMHFDYHVQSDKTYILIEMKDHRLPGVEKHRGPPVWVKNTEDFVKKYGRSVYLEGERLWVDRKRDVTNFEEALLLISDRVGLGSDITPMIPAKMEMIGGKELVEKNHLLMNKFLDRTFPWER